MDRSKFGFYILTAFVFLFTVVILGINSSYSIDENSVKSWDVAFTSVDAINEGSKYDMPKLIKDSTSLNDINFSFDNGTDKLSYKINVLNNGTVDAKIAAITLIDAKCNDESLCDNLEYSLTYEDGSLVNRGDVLAKKSGTTLYLNFRYNGVLDKELAFSDFKVSINYIER